MKNSDSNSNKWNTKKWIKQKHIKNLKFSFHNIMLANGIGDDIYVREKPPKLGKSSCRKFVFVVFLIIIVNFNSYLNVVVVNIRIGEHF